MFLNVLKKEVPKYDWKLQRIESKTLYHDINTFGKGDDHLRYHYETEYNGVKGWVHIDTYEGSDDIKNIDVSFDDSISYINKHNKIMTSYNGETEDEMWVKIREFFETYLIPQDELIEKKIPTPRMDNLKWKMGNVFHYEYNQMMMDSIYGKYDEDKKKEITYFLEEVRKMYTSKREDLGLELTTKETDEWFRNEWDVVKTLLTTDGLYDVLDTYLLPIIEYDMDDSLKMDTEMKEVV